MGLDKFGRTSSDSAKKRKILVLPTRTIQFTEHGNIDCENKKICNVAEPNDGTDAINLKYMRNNTVGFTFFGNVNCRKKQLVNVAEPTADTDAVTIKFLLNHLKPWALELDKIKKTLSKLDLRLQQTLNTTDNKIENLQKTMSKLELGLQQALNTTDDKIVNLQANINKIEGEFRSSLQTEVNGIKKETRESSSMFNVRLQQMLNTIDAKITNTEREFRSSLETEVKGIKKETRQSFNHIENKIQKNSNDMVNLKKDFKEIKEKFSSVYIRNLNT